MRFISFRLNHPQFRNFTNSDSCHVTSKTQNVTNTDLNFMKRALNLAEKGSGRTFPNPVVGCVIVKNNKVVGEGYHPSAGKPHAEIYALRAASNDAKGATAYVTLEPCNHFGRTPPCSRALIDAKIAKVVVGVVDPNPLVGGAGIKRLQKHGVDVVVNCLEDKCYEINVDFMERMKSEH
eukprot:g8772.t1